MAASRRRWRHQTVLGNHNALRRSAAVARQVAIQTDTHLVIVKDGKLLRISPEELRQSVEGNTPQR